MYKTPAQPVPANSLLFAQQSTCRKAFTPPPPTTVKMSVKKEEAPIPAQTFKDDGSGVQEIILGQLPAKVLENCQRTGRVVIISELEKKLNKDKRQRSDFCKILSEFVPKSHESELGECYEGKSYYKSLNYSRVRIGHKQFIKRILSNPQFRRPLEQIFYSDTLQNSQKARKNERSPVSFEERKKILERVLEEYKAKFLATICKQDKQQPHQESSTVMEAQAPLEQKQPQKQKDRARMLPLIPIPLSPEAFQAYLASKI